MEEKKKIRKLVVNKRAVRELGANDLRRVAGGGHISQYCSGSSTSTCTVACSDKNTTFF